MTRRFGGARKTTRVGFYAERHRRKVKREVEQGDESESQAEGRVGTVKLKHISGTTRG